jgi:hypothetical protein
MDFDNTMDYYFSDDESSNDSLSYSDDEYYDDDDGDDAPQTPPYSIFNKNHNISVESSQESPNQNSRPYCSYYFPNPSFSENDEPSNKTHNKHRIIDQSIIDEIRINFRNIMLELQEGELIIPATEEMNVSRKRSLSLDIEHVDECIHNGTIYISE